jgi:hypothetical protein
MLWILATNLHSDDEPNSTGVVKTVTFADAVDSTVEEADADGAATSGGTGTHSAATPTATTTQSSRVSRLPIRLGDYETKLSLVPEAFQGAASQADYIAHMLNLDVEEFAKTNISLPSTVGAIDIIGSYVESEFDPEVLLVGAGSLEGFQHTVELCVMNYREAMALYPQ